MADTPDDLSAKLKSAAEKMIGSAALTSKFGIDCFALVDKLLRSLDANTPKDYGKVTGTADYTWGDGILLDSLQPGDILQFRDHVVDAGTWKLVNNNWMEVEGRTQRRPHHTAVVIDVAKDGSVTVVEQNVKPDPKKITRNIIPRLESGEETREISGTERIKIKVTGSVRAFRAVPKPPKGANLLPPSQPTNTGWRMAAHVVPSQGGSKRDHGPSGFDAPEPSVRRWQPGEPGGREA